MPTRPDQPQRNGQTGGLEYFAQKWIVNSKSWHRLTSLIRTLNTYSTYIRFEFSCAVEHNWLNCIKHIFDPTMCLLWRAHQKTRHISSKRAFHRPRTMNRSLLFQGWCMKIHGSPRVSLTMFCPMWVQSRCSQKIKWQIWKQLLLSYTLFVSSFWIRPINFCWYLI